MKTKTGKILKFYEIWVKQIIPRFLSPRYAASTRVVDGE